jgi:serine/threonine-protein kinase HipA
MDELKVFVGSTLAGWLTLREGQYHFRYERDYEGPPVFLGLPVSERERSWQEFPPPFDGLLPEGVLLEQLLVKHKLDRSDKWGQLIAVGMDLTGFLSVIPADSEQKPFGNVVPGKQLPKRASIRPGMESLPYDVNELDTFHSTNKLRMSLSGVQPKVSAIYSRKRQAFQVVEQNGAYILKPSSQAFPGAAENEACTMALAREAGLEVPPCGFVRTKDTAVVFWIERFDRRGQGNRQRIRVEDACQLLEVPSSWKYNGNLESLARVVCDFCSNPKLQLVYLFHRVLFCWITGNGDMHLKNWSLIEKGPLIQLSPAYDFLNTVILTQDDEDSALALDDRKTGFNRSLLVDYFGREVCKNNDRMIENTLSRLASVNWRECITASCLSTEHQKQYLELVKHRLNLLSLV